MGSGGTVAIIVVFVLFAVGIAVVSYLAAKKRREEMAAYAASRGWTYVEDEPLLVDRFGGSPFGLGHGRRAFNVIYGKHDSRDFTSFDYVYKTTQSNGKTTTTVTHPFSVLAVSTGAPMPALSVDPEGIFGTLADKLSGSAIDLESEEFNRAFTVRCPDRKFASDVLHPLMMDYLLQHRTVGWRFERDSLLVVAKGSREVGEIDATLDFMDGVGDRVPDFVWARLRGQA